MSSSHSSEREPLLSSAQNGRGHPSSTQSTTDASESSTAINESSPATEASSTVDGDDEAVAESVELTDFQVAWKTSGLFLGSFVGALDSTLVAVLSAPISSSFSNMPLLGWLASAFFIASAASQPVAGKLTDIYGRRSSLLFVSAIFTLGNIICACAQTEWMLLLGRVVAGLGGGALFPVGSIVVSDYVPLRRRGVWQGIGGIVFGLGSGIGGPLGGWISDVLNWRWAFAVQVPVTVASMILIAVQVLPLRTDVDTTPVKKSKFRRIDFVGAILLVTSILLMLLGLTSGGNLVPWTHPAVLTALPASVVALVVFIIYEHRVAEEPILPVKLLANRTVAAVSSATWFTTMARFGFLFYAPIYLQIHGYTAAQTGLRFVPESVMVAVLSITCGIIMRWTGKYYVLSVSIQALMPFALTLITTWNLSTPPWQQFLYITLIGSSYTALLTTSLVAVLAAVERQYVPVITSVAFVSRTLGTVTGIAIASAVYQNALRHNLHDRLDHLEDSARIIRDVQDSLAHVFELPEPVQGIVRQAFMDSLHLVFLTLLGIAVVGFACGACMKEHPLFSKLSRRPSR